MTALEPVHKQFPLMATPDSHAEQDTSKRVNGGTVMIQERDLGFYEGFTLKA